MKRLAVIDGNALAHVVKHATKNLSFNGSNTGVLFGLIRKLFNIQEKIFANKFIWCWDSSEELERKKIYPAYKENRVAKKAEEEKLNSIAIPQFNIARLFMLPTMGFNNHFKVEGLESDDIIGKICDQYSDRYEIVIVSRDNDFYQFLKQDRICMFDPVKFSYRTERSFKEENKCRPDEWNNVKAITGCSGDGVSGVPGVGIKTAVRFLHGDLKPSTKAYKDIIANEEMILENLRLVLLPWETTPEIEFCEDNLTENGFIDVCMEYGFKSYLAEGLQDKFRQLFMEAQNGK